MNLRALALGAVLGIAVALVPSCGSKCGPNNCNGCCDASGQCVSKPNNGLHTSCGSGGQQCADCSTAGQLCNALSFTCQGSAGGGDGGTGGCSGCRLPGGLCVPGTSTNNCGSGGAICKMCPTGQLCINQACQTPSQTKKIGDPCTNNSDCSALGSTAICKTVTSSGNATYTGGYCTLPCSTSGPDTVCGDSAFCAALVPRYGESDVFCWDKCANGDPCRSPGYRCYALGGPTGCWLSPLPAQDAGPPADKIGEPCAMDSQCQNPPDQGGICDMRDDLLGLLFPGGYCSTTYCAGDDECAADGGAKCVNLGAGDKRCMRRCAAGGSPADAGQSDCREGYLCLDLLLPDGGRTSDGICVPPTPPPPTTVGQACTTNAQCTVPSNSVADCITESAPLSDGGSRLTGYPSGYCSRFNCQGDNECGPNDAGLCLLVNTSLGANVVTSCYAACPEGGKGQSTCRSGYVCLSTLQEDGGASLDGYCDSRCDAPGAGACPVQHPCDVDSGYCR